MLYDPNWKPTIAPAEVPAIEPWRQILIEAADVIKRRGWIKGDFQESDGVCAIGAFRVVQHGDGTKRHGRHPNYDPADLERAKRKLWAAIPAAKRPTQTWSDVRLAYSSASIQRWNDDRCSSKAEIIRYFKKAAAGE